MLTKILSVLCTALLVCAMFAGLTFADDELEFVTLTWYFPGSAQIDEEMVEDALQEYLAEKGLNCRVDLNPIDWGAWETQTTAMINSQEEFDIMFTAGWSGYLRNASKGAFLDITDLFDVYLPKTKAMLPQAYYDGVLIKGRSYGVATNKDLAHTWGIVYRSDIAEEVGADMSGVKCLADLGPVLEKVKEAHPELIGIAMDKKDNTKTLLDWDPICAQEIPAKLYPNKDLTVICEYFMPETEGLLNTARDFYLKGYIRDDAATLDDRRPDYQDGKAFCYTTTLKPLVEFLLTDSSGFPFEQLSFTDPFITSNDATGSINAVSSTSKNPERALMFLELMNTDPYVNNLVNFGIEGVHYVKPSEVERTYLEGVTRQTVTYHAGADWELGNQFLNLINASEKSPNKWELFSAFNASGKPSLAMGFVFDPTPVETEIAAIKLICDQYSPFLFTGASDPAEVLPEFQQELKEAGIDKLVAEAQAQLDAWAASR